MVYLCLKLPSGSNPTTRLGDHPEQDEEKEHIDGRKMGQDQ